MAEPKFEVYGDIDILRNVKINIETIRQEEYPHEEIKIETLVFNGNVYDVQNNNVLQWNIYFSYKDSVATCLSVENIMWPAPDHINKLYIEHKDGDIFITYIGRKEDIEQRKGFRSIALDIDKFLETRNIKTESDRDTIMQKLFTFYEPSKQMFERIIIPQE